MDEIFRAGLIGGEVKRRSGDVLPLLGGLPRGFFVVDDPPVDMEDVGDIVLFQITDRLLLGEGAPPVDDDEVIGIVFQLFDGEGGVIIDTAQIYGFGDFA